MMRRFIFQRMLIGLSGFVLAIISQFSFISAQENQTFISFAQELQLQDDADAHYYTSYNNDLRITYNQKLALDRFKKRMAPVVPHAYMKDDIYLIRWLRAAEFDVNNAEELLTQSLKWRKQNKIDSILEEDFSDLFGDQPNVNTDIVDKKGQPVISNTIWNFRNAWVTGRDGKLLRYVIMLLERTTKMIRDGQRSGKNITRFDYIINMEPFNLIQHGCSRCMLSYFNILRSYEQNYPDMVDRLTIINAPHTIRALFEPLVRNVFTYNTMRSVNLRMFGTNKIEWQRYLKTFIDENQLPDELGGKRVTSS